MRTNNVVFRHLALLTVVLCTNAGAPVSSELISEIAADLRLKLPFNCAFRVVSVDSKGVIPAGVAGVVDLVMIVRVRPAAGIPVSDVPQVVASLQPNRVLFEKVLEPSELHAINVLVQTSGNGSFVTCS